MKRILLKFLFINLFIFCLLILLFSCKKENITSNNLNESEAYVKNIYHSKYTNVVKIQGKYVIRGNYDSYFYLGGRKEGEYDNYDIFDAIRNGSLKRVVELAEEDDSVIDLRVEYASSEYNLFMDDFYNINGATPLILAVFYRDIGIIQYFLDLLYDSESIYEETDDDGWNVFIWACAVGTVDIIKALISKNSDLVYSTNPYDANGLHMAALNDNIQVFDYLVNDLGIAVNSTDEDGDNVLYYAKTDEAIESLKELGADY